MKAQQPDDPGDYLIVINRYYSVPDAELARGRLESEGIPAFVFDENMVSAQWLYSQAIGGMRLMVRAQDAAKAAEILSLEPIKEEELAKEAGATEDVTCPKCGSGNVKRGFFTVYGTSCLGIIGIVLCYILPVFLISNVILVAVPWGYRCRACGYKWRKQKAEKPAK
jgi:hypothetical protein